MRIRDSLGISPTWQRRLTWVMEVALVGILFIGIDRGNGKYADREPGIRHPPRLQRHAMPTRPQTRQRADGAVLR